MFSVMMIATQWGMLEPFIPVSFVSHNEVVLSIVTVEIEKHQRCALCSFITPDEYIHSFLPRSSQSPPFLSWQFLSALCFSFRLKSLSAVARCSLTMAVTSLKLISIWDFLYKSPFPPSKTFFFCLFKTRSIPGHNRRWGNQPWAARDKIFHIP